MKERVGHALRKDVELVRYRSEIAREKYRFSKRQDGSEHTADVGN